MSIRDVARKSGVSLTTVSLILNHEDQRITEATRDRVRAAIKELGDRPNRLAQGLQNRRSHILAILVPHLTHTFADVYFGELISGIYDEASAAEYKILMEVASLDFIQQKEYLNLYDRCFVDGILFMGSHDGHTFVRELGGRHRPFVLVNNVMGECDHVVCDYEAAGRLAAEFLAGLGHRRIGLICGAAQVRTACRIRDSFIETLGERGIAVPPVQMEDGRYTEEGGAEAAERLAARVPDLTAVFAGNDKMAIGAMQRLQEMGRRIPKEVSVMGCDDIRQAAFATPALTTISTPLYDLGRRCCRRMLDILRGRADTCRETLPVELRVRHSTAPLR